jgi:hypothetical protein
MFRTHKNITHTAICVRTPKVVTKAMVAKKIAIKGAIVAATGAAIVVAAKVMSSDNEN